MSASLPEHPNLEQLRRQAKELRDAARTGDPAAVERVANHHVLPPAGEFSLAAAQLVIARELGFSSWPKLKAAIDIVSAPRDSASAFVAASVENRLREAAELLQADPGIVTRSLRAAAAYGDTDAVRAALVVHPEMGLLVDDESGWPPLLYVCYSRWHLIDPSRAKQLAEVARLLLDAGASPHTNNGAFRDGYRSALSGVVEVNNPEVVRVLLDAGANPDDGRCIGQAADLHDHRCLELLLARGARVTGTWALGAAVYADDPEAVSLLLDALRTANVNTTMEATNALADAAAANSSTQVVDVLLAAGADPNVHDSDAGRSALRCAVRIGDEETAALLIRHGATDDSTDVDRFIAACLTGERQRAERILVEDPDLRERLSEEDRAVVVNAASRPAETIALMLDVGFSPHTRDGLGQQPLHFAAYLGNAPTVRVLVAAGADIDARDGRFDATPLCFATVGSGEHTGKPGEWIETVRFLIEAGASRDDVWISDKPPSEEVADVLRHYGITPGEPQEQDDPGDGAEVPRVIGTGLMGDVARHLEAAYRDEDLDLLGSLLHAEVTWTGLCHNKAQVLDWYRGFLAEGTVATVNSLEVDRDAVVLGLRVSRRAEGARPAPPRQLYQVATVDDGEIVDIQFFPDRESAIGRP